MSSSQSISSEQQLKSATAAVQRGVARADGKLHLTASRLEFTPYNTQFGLGPYSFERGQIAGVEKCLGKGGGILPVTTDALRISLTSGDSYEFILANPEEWIAAIGGH